MIYVRIRNDPSVLCSSSNYDVGFVWATATALVYLIGVPVTNSAVDIPSFPLLPLTFPVDALADPPSYGSCGDRFADR